MTKQELEKLQALAKRFSLQGVSVKHSIAKNQRKRTFEYCASQLLVLLNKLAKGCE